MPTAEKYINLFTDFGFKKIFGQEPNKDLLLDFLTELLQEEQGRITVRWYPLVGQYCSLAKVCKSSNSMTVFVKLFCWLSL